MTDEPVLRAAIRAAWDRAASNTSAGDCIELEDLLAASSAASDDRDREVERIETILHELRDAKPGELARRLIERGWHDAGLRASGGTER